MDLQISRYADYEQLELYCYRVASVVGLLSIEIFGYTQPACRDYAVYLGKALQFTNILRDVRTDARRGRIYIPETELARFHVEPEQILAGEYSENFKALAGSVAERARGFYRLASQTLPAPDRRAMSAAELMGAVYWLLLLKIKQRRFNVFGPVPTRLTKFEKLRLVLRTGWRVARHSTTPNYGVERTPNEPGVGETGNPKSGIQNPKQVPTSE
jgi:phytoene synthase